MKRTIGLTFLSVATFVFVSLSFLQTIHKAFAEPRGTIRVGLPSEIDLLEPNNTTNKYAQVVAHQHIFESLVYADESMNIKPNLATSWDVAKDGSAITFQLRRGVKFHDGTPLNARAVKVSFDRIRDLNFRHWGRLAKFIKSVDVVDENTARINLIGSPGQFINVLAIYGYIESPAAAEKYGKDIGRYPTGTGPYKFVEWVSDSRVVLEANKEYWGGEPKTARLVFRPIPDPQTRSAMLEAGDLDVVLRPSYVDIDKIKSNPATQIYDWVSGEMLFVWFNTVKAPFNDKRIRQAITHSIDRKGIVNALLFGRSELANSFASPLVKYILKYDLYPYNPEKAKSLFASAGWNPGKSGFLEKDGEVFRSAIVTPSGRYPMDVQVAEAIQAQLKKVGIDMKVNVLESTAFIKTLFLEREAKQNADFGVVIASDVWGPVADTIMTSHYYSKSQQNFGFYANAEVDRCIEEGVKTSDEAKAAGLYKTAQDILADEIPWVPITAFKDFAGMRKGVKGVTARNPFIHFFVTKDGRIEP